MQNNREERQRERIFHLLVLLGSEPRVGVDHFPILSALCKMLPRKLPTGSMHLRYIQTTVELENKQNIMALRMRLHT